MSEEIPRKSRRDSAVRHMRSAVMALEAVEYDVESAQRHLAEARQKLAMARQDVEFIAPGRARALPLTIRNKVTRAINTIGGLSDAIAAIPLTGVERQAAQVKQRNRAKAVERTSLTKTERG